MDDNYLQLVLNRTMTFGEWCYFQFPISKFMHIHYKGFERKIGHYIPIVIDVSIITI
jgi:hypothetical protein